MGSLSTQARQFVSLRCFWLHFGNQPYHSACIHRTTADRPWGGGEMPFFFCAGGKRGGQRNGEKKGGAQKEKSRGQEKTPPEEQDVLRLGGGRRGGTGKISRTNQKAAILGQPLQQQQQQYSCCEGEYCFLKQHPRSNRSAQHGRELQGGSSIREQQATIYGSSATAAVTASVAFTRHPYNLTMHTHKTDKDLRSLATVPTACFCFTQMIKFTFS